MREPADRRLSPGLLGGLARGPAMAKTRSDLLTGQAAAAWEAAQDARRSGDLAGALRLLERAHRIAPMDPSIALGLASLCLLTGGASDAVAALAPVVERHDLREAWFTLAAARHRLEDPPAAAAALHCALSGHVLPRDGNIGAMAEAIAVAIGAPGWCGIDAAGRLALHAPPAKARNGRVILADGRRLAGRAIGTVPPPSVRRITVTQDDRKLLGSPLRIDEMRRLEGVVATANGGLAGWAWHPRDPDADPTLCITDAAGHGFSVQARDAGMLGVGPLARPRGFEVPAERLAALRGPLHVCGADGRDLPGSPLDPAAERAAAAAAARSVAARFALRAPDIADTPPLPAIPAALTAAPATARLAPERPVAVVVPVYAGSEASRTCLLSVFATCPPGTPVIVVDDATPEPALASLLDAWRAAGRIVLLRHAINRGFPRSANAGLRAAGRLPGRPDIVLLNSDTLATPGWLARLRAAVHSAPDIGSASPFSNAASILSYPDRDGANPLPEPPALRALARRAARANPGLVVEIPTGVGFCMYIRRECLAETGLFREDVFAQGYGEENDFCLRARHLGWRHVAVPGAFVAHRGGQSFGAGTAALMQRNSAVLEQLHPGYAALIAAFQAADTLAPARRRLDMASWRAGSAPAGAVLLIAHDNGGGVERVVRARCAALRRAGQRPVLLRPARDAAGEPAPGQCVVGDEAGATPNLRFAIPAELPALARLLRADRPVAMEVHHLLGHAPEVLLLADRLGIPTDFHLHDYAMLCPRIALVGRERRYCGEPEDPAVCDGCVADLGSAIGEQLGVAALRARSAGQLAAARHVRAPSRDVARRWQRYFPAIASVIAPLEDDAALPPRAPSAVAPGMRHVCVIGAIGVEKGYDILLACARDAAARRLALRFTLVGHSEDDARLMQTGRVFVTGPYREADLDALIRRQEAHLAWVPSICPETWCFTLGEAWRAGLSVAAFDIGAPAERIRAAGRGWVLPLGLPPQAINAALLAAAVSPAPRGGPPLRENETMLLL